MKHLINTNTSRSLRKSHSERKQTMMYRITKVMLVFLTMAAIGVATNAQDTMPESPSVIYQTAFPDQYVNVNVVEAIVDLEPGASFPLHRHGGTVFALVLDGEVTLAQDGNETVYTAGESWIETPTDVHVAFNASDAPARILATFLLPPGVEATIAEHDAEMPAIPPSITQQAVFPNISVNGPFTGVQVVLEFMPGAKMPLHVHGGPVFVLVLEGEITLRENGEEMVYGPGESWMEMPGIHHEAFNNGDDPVRVAATFLLAPGAEATVFAQD